MPDITNHSVRPWRLTINDENSQEVYHYTTKTLAFRWAMQAMRKHKDVSLDKYEHGQYHKRSIPEPLIERAKREAF